MYDQHLHTCFSYDAQPGNTPELVIEKAIALGLEGIAITDHLDPLFPDDKYPSIIDLPNYEKALAAAEETYKRTAPGFHFAKGIELGVMPVPEALSVCAQTVSGFPYDFVIASVHSSPVTPIDYAPFLTGRSIRAVNEEYYAILYESMQMYKDYDVLGHVNAIDRYTDSYAPEEVYLPLADEVLRLAIADGKGIEVNTSAFRYGISDRGTPTQAILHRFRELGGEIVTLGSDAHKSADIGTYLDAGAAMLRAAGFSHYAVFKNRTPSFVRI
jgi:histidinol-phosphatase (PHP family)